MIFKTLYKPDLTKTDIIEGKVNILSWNSKIKDNKYLPITKFGWGFIWILIKTKLKKHPIFLCITIGLDKTQYIDFFTILKKK